MFNKVQNQSIHSIHSMEEKEEEEEDVSFERLMNSQIKVEDRSSVLLREIKLMQELQHFGRERIPERVVHAKGSAAFGHFRVTNDHIIQYCKASLFADVDKETPVAVRFSSVTGERGSADTVFGEMRGFAVKFYTEEGVWDLVGNNVPIFAIRDASQFPAFIHANKPNPRTGLRDQNSVWDFNSLRSETLNLITYVFSDFGIPNGFRHMPGFSINAFKLVNSHNKHVFAKFHWYPHQGIDNLDIDTAAYLRGVNPDYARQDLFDAITNHRYPKWTLKIQVMNQKDVDNLEFNAFDATKYWPEDRFPFIDVGVMTLDRNVDNFFAETEQLAFCPSNLVDGIEPSPDRMLMGRLFSYSDTQRYRLGSNHQLIPVNEPINGAITPTLRDGQMRVDNNFDGLPNYYPNSFSLITDNPVYLEPPFTIKTTKVFRYDDSNDHNYIRN
ncbi:catalase-like [Oppia nitens]|uniref:catalase-like n=1 Tax=Oppia nitens TaxID=1686743 RepID=UPI0023D9A723|nr:catalase-like [Oppia nitens]